MAQNLQNFVEQFFPSIAKRINFRFGTLRGINLYITCNKFPTCSVRDAVELKYFFFFENITEFITNYKTLLKEQLSDCDNNIHYAPQLKKIEETLYALAVYNVTVRDKTSTTNSITV